MAQALHNGDADALAQIFDRHASRLYDYAHALLRDQESAADAVHDGLLSAQAHIGRLRQHELFRGWLYALVRNESLRRMNDPDRLLERHPAADAEETFLNAEEEARRHETRLLVHSGLAVLSGRQREAVDLVLRHGLDVRELARIFGTSPEEASELVGQAHRTLDEALVAAVIARTGRDECRSVAALVDPEDWPLNSEACGKLVRHVETCPTCNAQRARAVSTAELLHVLPVALMPVDLGWELLTFANAPERAEDRAVIAQWAEPFDEWGWPASVGHEPHRPERKLRRWPAVVAAASVIIVVVSAFMWLPRSSGNNSVAAAPSAAGSPEVSDSAEVSPSESELPTDTPTPTPTVSTSSPTPSPTRPRPRPSTTKPTTKPPTPGTLSVGPGGPIGDNDAISVPLAAVGGPVSWSATPGPNLSVSKGSGSLGAGDSTAVTITLDRSTACEDEDGPGSSSVTFSPGAKKVTVDWTCTE
ncbi:MAG: RNA polymerase sigma factor [Actinomadura sp.]